MRELNLNKLLIRPRKNPLESHAAYIMRVAKKNHLSGISCLAKILDVQPVELLCATIDYRDDPIKIVIHSKSIGEKISTPSALGRSWFTRICPSCINQGVDYGLAVWDRPLQIFCEKHQTMLMDACPRCGLLLRHDRSEFSRCKCGQNFLDVSTNHIPAWVKSMSIAFTEAVQHVGEANLSSPIERQAAKALNFFANCKADPNHYGQSVKRDKIGMVLSPIFKFLEQCFQDSWVGVPKEFELLYAADTSLGVKGINNRFGLPVFLHVSTHLIEMRKRNAKLRINSRTPIGHKNEKKIPLNNLAKLTGLSDWKVRKLAFDGLIAEIQLERCPKRGCFLYEMDSSTFLKLESKCNNAFSLSFTAAHNGISEITTMQLFTLSAVKSNFVRIPLLEMLFTQEEQVALISNLMSQTYLDPAGLLFELERLPLCEALDLAAESLPRFGIKRLIDAFDASEFRLYACNDSPSTVRDFYVGFRDFHNWLEAFSLSPVII